MNKKQLWFFIIFFMIVLVFATINLFLTSNQLDKCEFELGSSKHSEVINGNLYIGYEDGKRIGYHYFNNSFYRNGIKLNDVLGRKAE